MRWSERPMLRLVILLIAGILIASVLPVDDVAVVSLYAGLTVSLVNIIIVLNLKYNRVRYRLSAVLLSLAVIITGMLLAVSKKPYDVCCFNNELVICNAVISSNPSETKKCVKSIVEVTGVDSAYRNLLTGSLIQCYFQKNSSSKSLRHGDVIILKCRINNPSPPMNPYEFDYSQFLSRKGIYYTAYVDSLSWTNTGSVKRNIFSMLSGELRFKMLSMLKRNGMHSDDYAVAAAILLGYDDGMDFDLRQNYVRAGAMHILCVSGLHVGIIYLVFNALLGLLIKGRKSRWINSGLLLAVIWFYAFLSGLSPSVGRASLMLSVVIIGNMLNRSKDTINSIAASAVLLLVFDPMLLYDVGFQLSYAAVLGIVIFHKHINNLFYFNNYFPDKVWEITALAISAQLATFPLAVYYFHFFPTWFWLSNLFTFPLSFAVIICGFAFIVFSWVPYLGILFGHILSVVVLALNYLIDAVKYMPLSGVDGIYLSGVRLVLIYLALAYAYYVFIDLKFNRLKVLLGVVVVFLFVGLFERVVQREDSFTVFCVRKHTVIGVVNKDNAMIVSDSVIVNNQGLLDYNIKNFLTVEGVLNNTKYFDFEKNIIDDDIYMKGNVLLFDEFKILLNNKYTFNHSDSLKLNIDYVICCGRDFKDISDLHQTYNFTKVIIDSTVPFKYWERITKEAAETGCWCYNVNTSGSFTKAVD